MSHNKCILCLIVKHCQTLITNNRARTIADMNGQQHNSALFAKHTDMNVACSNGDFLKRANKNKRNGITELPRVQIDIISHSLRRASSQNGTSHEGHEESTRCHWFDCQSCIHEGCRVHRAEAKSSQKEVGHERPAANRRESRVNKATSTKLATARGSACP